MAFMQTEVFLRQNAVLDININIFMIK